MPAVGRVFGLVVGVFVALGVAGGGVGAVALEWARTQFVVDAAGAQPETFGPAFVAAVALQTTVTLFVVGVAVAALVGTLAGSRFARPGRAGGVAGGGSLVGFYLMAAVGVAALTLVGGEGTAQVYDVGQAVRPALVAGALAGGAGAAGGVVGSWLAG